jgi:hypothetical protein
LEVNWVVELAFADANTVALLFGRHKNWTAETSTNIVWYSVTPAFLALNKTPTKSRVFSKHSRRARLPPSKPRSSSLSHPRRTCRESRRHRPHPGHRPSRAAPAPRSATMPGIPRMQRFRRPDRLAITAIPKIMLKLETGKPRTLLPLISVAIL